MSELLQKLEAYGADIPGAMERLLGDEALYRRYLDLLLEDRNFPDLMDSVSERDVATAFDCAHAIMGAAGNLGLTPLYETVRAAVEPLRRGDLTHAAELAAAVLTGRNALEHALF